MSAQEVAALGGVAIGLLGALMTALKAIRVLFPGEVGYLRRDNERKDARISQLERFIEVNGLSVPAAVRPRRAPRHEREA